MRCRLSRSAARRSSRLLKVGVYVGCQSLANAPANDRTWSGAAWLRPEGALRCKVTHWNNVAPNSVFKRQHYGLVH